MSDDGEGEAPLKPKRPDLPVPDFSHLPSEEDFADWCEHPVTRFVVAAFEAAARACKDQHLEGLWTSGKYSAELFQEARFRAEDYRALQHTRYEDYVIYFDPHAKLGAHPTSGRKPGQKEPQRLRTVHGLGSRARSASKRLRSGLKAT